jgi:hypothetical protein
MATRSRIAVRNTNDEGYTSIYVHWDGSPDTRLPLLNEYWTDESKLRELMDGGSVSLLDTTIVDTVFYARNRDEELNIKYSESLTELTYDTGSLGEEYLYIFENNTWTVR